MRVPEGSAPAAPPHCRDLVVPCSFDGFLAPMFEHRFADVPARSPTFEAAGASFCLVATADSLVIEYLGRSYEPLLADINLIIDATAHIFVFEFSRGFSWYALPLPKAPQRVCIAVAASQSRAPFLGLRNLGATCYINSLVQALYFLPLFRERLFAARGYHALLLQRLFYRLDAANAPAPGEAALPGAAPSTSSSSSTASPRTAPAQRDRVCDAYDALATFIRNLTCVDSVNTHQDVHEFSKILLDLLEKDDKRLTEPLEGRLINIVECACGCVHKQSDPFQDLQLNIADAETPLPDLYASLDVFCRSEELSGYACETHGAVDAERRACFERFPRVLFVLIGRFGIDWETCTPLKSNAHYAFYEDIDLSPYSDGEEDGRYHLYGVLVHAGVADEGHFYCYLRLNGRYYKFNDKSVYEAAREEALDWNFGGNHPYNGTERMFSAYYLVYIHSEEIKRCRARGEAVAAPEGTDDTPSTDSETVLTEFNSHSLVAKMSSEDARAITAPRKQCAFQYLTNSRIARYVGPGRFNTNDYAYPITAPGTESCYEFDNVAKLVAGRVPFDEQFKRIENAPVDPSVTYFMAPAGRPGPLAFIKRFTPDGWCAYPSNLVSLGAFMITGWADIAQHAAVPNCLVFREQLSAPACAVEPAGLTGACQEGAEAAAEENAVAEETEEGAKRRDTSLPAVQRITALGEIKNGDVLITVAPREGAGTELALERELVAFMEALRGHQMVNAVVGGVTLPVFLPRGLDATALESALRAFFVSSALRLANPAAAPLLDARHCVACEAEGEAPVYVGTENGCVDVNLIDHVHPFLLPVGATRDVLLKQFRLSKARCMAALQAVDELQVVATVKRSMNARLLDANDVVCEAQAVGNDGPFVVLQRRMARPVRMVFFSGAYQLIGYPFFIECPGTVREMRERLFFSGRIVRFNGVAYTDCGADDSLDLPAGETILIEKK